MNPLKKKLFDIQSEKLRTYNELDNAINIYKATHNRRQKLYESQSPNARTMYTRRFPSTNAEAASSQDVKIERTLQRSQSLKLSPLTSYRSSQKSPFIVEDKIGTSNTFTQHNDNKNSEGSKNTDQGPSNISEDIYASIKKPKYTTEHTNNENTSTVHKPAVSTLDMANQIEALSDKAFIIKRNNFQITEKESKNSAYDISNAVNKHSTLPDRTSYIENDVMSVRSMLHINSQSKQTAPLTKWTYTFFALSMWTFIVLCIEAIENKYTNTACTESKKWWLGTCYVSLVAIATIATVYFEHCKILETIFILFLNALLLLLLHDVPLKCTLKDDDVVRTVTSIRAVVFLCLAVAILILWIVNRIQLRKQNTS